MLPPLPASDAPRWCGPWRPVRSRYGTTPGHGRSTPRTGMRRRGGAISILRDGDARMASMRAAPVTSPFRRRNSSSATMTTPARPFTVTCCGPSLRARRTTSLRRALASSEDPRVGVPPLHAHPRTPPGARCFDSGHADQSSKRTLAIIAAYVLADELAAGPTHTVAFARYESRLQPFMKKARLRGPLRGIVRAETRLGLSLRDGLTRALAIPGVARLALGASLRDDVDLPEYVGAWTACGNGLTSAASFSRVSARNECFVRRAELVDVGRLRVLTADEEDVLAGLATADVKHGRLHLAEALELVPPPQ